jgi:hypothetical protein
MKPRHIIVLFVLLGIVLEAAAFYGKAEESHFAFCDQIVGRAPMIRLRSRAG